MKTKRIEPAKQTASVGWANEAHHALPVQEKAGQHSLRQPGTILLISDDVLLHQTLRALANDRGHMVVRVAGAAGIVQVLQVLRPAAVLLDLDLNQDAGWKAGEALLQEQNCPPLFLITGHKEQFDFRTAIRAGSVVDKSVAPFRVLEQVDEALALPLHSQQQRNALQGILLRWLRPR